MSLYSPADLTILRELAKRVREIAELPIQRERIALWKRHNALKGTRPMLLVFPEGAWRELMPHGTLKCEGEKARSMEWVLRERIYCHEHFCDDNVMHANVDVQKVVRSTGWGVDSKTIPSTGHLGAWKFDPVVFEPADLKRFRTPTVTYDEKATQEQFAQVHEALGDILNVRIRGLSHVSYHLMSQWTRWRGLEQTMMDMVEAPEFLHDAMRMLTESHKEILKQYIAQNLLDLNNDYTYHSSGGNGWSDELPAAGFDGKHVRPCDMWSSAESQELAEVSPCMHNEFALTYEKELLAPFALNGYGCCEALHNKLDDVMQIRNIRRLSMSPWTDLPLAARKLGRRAVFSWKPNPAMLVGNFNQDRIRSYIREALEVTRGCAFEMILKDTHTCESQPQRMDRWLQIAREEIERHMQRAC